MEGRECEGLGKEEIGRERKGEEGRERREGKLKQVIEDNREKKREVKEREGKER